MPLLKRKPVDLVPLPDPTALRRRASRSTLDRDEAQNGAGRATGAAAADDPEVFLLPETGEVFLDYEAYANRVDFYRQNFFQCELTGRIGMTFFEAQRSERREARKLHARFPEALKGPILHSCQFVVTGRLIELVEQVFDRLKDRFFEGEAVYVDVSGDKFYAKIKAVFPPKSVVKWHQEAAKARFMHGGAAAAAAAPSSSTPHTSPYKPKREPRDASPGSDVSELSDAPPVSQDPHASFLNGAPSPPLHNHHAPGAPTTSLDPSRAVHTLGADLSLDFDESIRVDPPDEYLYHVQLIDDEGAFVGSLMEVKSAKLSRDRLTFSKLTLKKYMKECLVREATVGSPWVVKQALAYRYAIPTAPDEATVRKNEQFREVKLSKRKKLTEEEDEERKSAKAAKAAYARQRRAAKAKAKAEAEAEAEEERRRQERRKNLKYPIEDLELDPITERELKSKSFEERVERRKDRPAPSKELPVPAGIQEPFLNTYHFLHAMGKPLGLSPFTLDDYDAALRHATHEPACTLLVEIHASLLNLVVRDGTPGSSSSSSKPHGAAGGKGAGRESGRSVVAGRSSAAKAEKRSRSGSAQARVTSRAGSEESDQLDSDREGEEEEDEEEEEEEAEEEGTGEEDEEERDQDGDSAEANGDGGGEAGHGDEGDGEGGRSRRPRAVKKREEEDEAAVEVLKAARDLGSGWEKKRLRYDEARAGWEASLIGLLAKRGDPRNFPRLIGILSHLTGVEHRDGTVDGRFLADTYASVVERYPALALSDKVGCLHFLCEQAVLTRAAKAWFEECETTLTELRKERAELSRARKKLSEDRAAFESANKKPEEMDTEEGAEGEAGEAETNGPAGANGKLNGIGSADEDVSGGGEADDRTRDDEDELMSAGSEGDDAATRAGQRAASAGSSSSARPRGAGASGSSSSGGGGGGSRQEVLRERALLREAEEAARREELARKREAQKLKSAEYRQYSLAKRKLDDEEARLARWDETIERDFRRHALVHRVVPLGKDRFHDRYWWFDGIGTATLGIIGAGGEGGGGGSAYSTGRLFVQGASGEEWTLALAENGIFSAAEIEARRREEHTAQGLLGPDEWGVYTQPEQIDELLSWLRTRGVREAALKAALFKYRDYLVHGMRKRQSDLAGGWRDGGLAAEATRRSARSKTEASHIARLPYMTYRNAMAK